jgi:hypothetical protein
MCRMALMTNTIKVMVCISLAKLYSNNIVTHRK